MLDLERLGIQVFDDGEAFHSGEGFHSELTTCVNILEWVCYIGEVEIRWDGDVL